MKNRSNFEFGMTRQVDDEMTFCSAEHASSQILARAARNLVARHMKSPCPHGELPCDGDAVSGKGIVLASQVRYQRHGKQRHQSCEANKISHLGRYAIERVNRRDKHEHDQQER